MTRASHLYSPEDLGVENYKWLPGGEIMAPCPFHNDSHPSLTVNLKTGVYFCFSCGASGPIDKLSRALGGHLVLKPFKVTPSTSQTTEWRLLLERPLALKNRYLKSRGVTKRQVEKFKIRSIKGQIVFPLMDTHGRTTGVLIRNNKRSGPKYVVAGQKPPMWPLINLDKWKKSGVVTEGVFGVLRADRFGISAMATLGAIVKKEALAMMSDAKPIVLFDDDFAGYAGAARILLSNPFAKTILPALEADEMSKAGWHAAINGDYGFSQDIGRIAKLSGDVRRFYETINRSRRFNNERKTGKSRAPLSSSQRSRNSSLSNQPKRHNSGIRKKR